MEGSCTCVHHLPNQFRGGSPDLSTKWSHGSAPERWWGPITGMTLGVRQRLAAHYIRATTGRAF